MANPRFIPLPDYAEPDAETVQARARGCYDRFRTRRTVRDFSDRPIPPGVLEDCLRAAGTAPSGAHQQPWHFVVVRDRETRRSIREAAEAEEQAFYDHRAPPEWLSALSPFGTDSNKPFLEEAGAVIAIFGVRWAEDASGERRKHYYVDESVGIATGLLIAALHEAGLVSLTHTPSPMGFLGEILERPTNERPFLLLVVGFPAENAQVPALERKVLAQIATFV